MNKARYWVLTVMAISSLGLVIVNIVTLNGNQNLQAQITERSLYVQQSLQLEGIYQPLVRTLAELSAQHNDEPLKDLLAAQGISVQIMRPTPTPAVPEEQPRTIVNQETPTP
jgi:hypothetical protein